MATSKVKNLKKADWQLIAKSHGISFTEENEVRYLVEKIAEKIGVDDKIVKLDDLKQAVHDKLESSSPSVKNDDNVSGEPVKEVKKSSEKKSETKKSPVKKSSSKVKKNKPEEEITIDPELELLHYRKEAQRLGVQYGVEQGTNEIKQFLDYFCQVNPPVTYVRYEETLGILTKEVVPTNTPVSGLSRLEELRKECEQYGVAYGSAHTENDLEQLLSKIRGLVPIQNTVPQNQSGNFELKVDNFDEVTSNAPVATNTSNPIGNANPNVMQVITAKQPTPTPIGLNDLNTYRTLFTQTIRNHFRLLFEHEVHEMLTRDRYPFNFQINKNPNQHNQIEIILSLGGNSVRVPSDNNNEWLSING